MPTEQVVKAATGFAKVMQNEPLSLALCVMNFSLIVFMYFQSSQFNSQRSDNVRLFTDVQREVQKLLSECIVPQRQQRGQVLDLFAPVPIGGSNPP